MHDTRTARLLVSDASAAELLEVALARIGCDAGAWQVTLHANDGHLRRAVAVQPAAPRTMLGRNQLDGRRPVA